MVCIVTSISVRIKHGASYAPELDADLVRVDEFGGGLHHASEQTPAALPAGANPAAHHTGAAPEHEDGETCRDGPG